MRVITLAGSPRFPSRSSSLLEYAREKLNGLDVEVYHWNLQNFAPEDLLYARFDSPALKTFTEQLQQADGLIVATPVYKAAYSGALKTLLDLLPERNGSNQVSACALNAADTNTTSPPINDGTPPELNRLCCR